MATKTNLHQSFRINRDAARRGVEVEVQEGIFFTIRSTTAPDVEDYMEARTRKQRHILQQHGWVLPRRLRIKNNVELLVEKLVIGWRGVTDEHGTPLTFTKPALENLLKEVPDLVDTLLSIASERETFNSAIVEELEGNFSPPSTPTSPSASPSDPAAPDA